MGIVDWIQLGCVAGTAPSPRLPVAAVNSSYTTAPVASLNLKYATGGWATCGALATSTWTPPSTYDGEARSRLARSRYPNDAATS